MLVIVKSLSDPLILEHGGYYERRYENETRYEALGSTA